jgi:hypothetical protein
MPVSKKQQKAACKVRHIPKSKRKAFKGMSKAKLTSWCKGPLHKKGGK